MKRFASRALSVLALLLAGALQSDGQRSYRDQNLDLIRFLATEGWGVRGHNRWDRGPGVHSDMEYRSHWAAAPSAEQMDWLDEDIRAASTKRSAVATALNGRRRRQSYQPGRTGSVVIDAGKLPAEVLHNLSPFFKTFVSNLQDISAQSPDQHAIALQPTVVGAPSSGGGGGGTGMRHLLALRPVPPNIRWACLAKRKGKCRTYNRRSLVEPEAVYPGANRHDPGLLWQGLGR